MLGGDKRRENTVKRKTDRSKITVKKLKKSEERKRMIKFEHDYTSILKGIYLNLYY